MYYLFLSTLVFTSLVTIETIPLNAQKADVYTTEDIHRIVAKERKKLESVYVEFTASRSASDNLLKDEIVKHLGKDSRQKVGIKNEKRYNDMWRIGFEKDEAEDRFLAVFDGERMYKRENKILEISSDKSYMCEQCVYLDFLLWPFTDDHMSQLEHSPYDAILLPNMLEMSHEWELTYDRFFELSNAKKGIKATFDPDKNMALVSYSLSRDATPAGFGKSRTVLSDYREINGVWLPFKIEAKSEVNKFQKNEIGGEISTRVIVSSLKINEEVSDSIFHLAQLPGETTYDRAGGFVSSLAPIVKETAIESVVASIEPTNAPRNIGKLLVFVAIFFLVGFLWGRLSMRTKKQALMLFALFGVQMLAREAFSQEEPPNYFVHIHRVSFQFTHDQSIKPFFQPSGQFFTPLPLLKLIESKNVFEELESVEYQLSDVRRAIESLESAIDEYGEARKKWELTPQVESGIFGEPVKSGREILESVFLPHQRKRMGQILQQFELSRIGVYESISYGNIGRLLKLPKSKLTKFKEESVGQFDKWNVELRKLKTDFFDQLTAPLDREQKKTVEYLFGEGIYNTPLFITVARADNGFYKNLKAYEDADLSASLERYRPLLLRNEFDIDVTGQVRPVTVTIKNPERKIYVTLLQILNSPKAIGYFALDGTQVQGIGELVEEWNVAKNRWTVDYGKFDGTDDQYKAKWKKIFSELREEHVQRVGDLLNNEQFEKLFDVGLKKELRCLGLQYSLTKGKVGQKLALSADDSTLIANTASELAESIRASLINMEIDWIALFENNLAPPELEKFNSLIGEKLDLHQGNIELHMLMLSSPMRDDIVPALIEQANVDLSTSLILPSDVK